VSNIMDNPISSNVLFAPKRGAQVNRAAAIFVWVALVTLTDAVVAGESTPVTPWVGETGVTETTAAIMARQQDYQRPPKQPWKTPKNRPRGRVNFENLLSSPDSPDVPTWPDGAGTGPLPSGQTDSLNFTGATLSDTAAFPPDSMGAAGPGQFIVAVNGRFRSFSKNTGAADGVLDVNPDVFFGSVMTPPVAQNFTSDPRIRYDRLSGRWFIIMIDVPGLAGALPNRILIAVSGSAVITPSTTWTFFQFEHDLVQPQNNSDTGKFADYPTLGVDASALYIGVNVFATRGQGSFANTTGFVVRKSSLLGAGPIVVTAFRKLVGNGPQGGPYTPQGVDNFDPSATEGYFIGVDSAYYGRLQLRRVSDPGGSPSVSGNILITVPLNGNTINVPHLGNTNGANGYLDGLDYRLMAAHIRNGRLWTCANIGVDNAGSPSGSDTRMGVRWYELSGIATGQTPSVIQSGTLFAPSGANDANQRHYWMGSIMVSGQGHALMGFSVAGVNERANAGYAGRLATDPLGTLRTPALYTASSSAYNPPSNPGGAAGRRWGDYSYTCVDPDDDMTMWTIQEWCNAPNSYAVQVLKVLAPPPATPTSANPSSLLPGQSNVNITITGTSVDGSGFFDPGAGFANRISASVLGGGVIVNGVTYQTPTSVTLNVSVASNAVPGTRPVTVVDPDGQSATSAAGLLAIGAAATNQPPALVELADQVVTEENLLTLAASATDPEGQALTLSLDGGAPAGAAINPTNGVFSWTPDEFQGPSTNVLTVRVTDSGSPPQSATRSFTATVLESNRPPQLAALADQIIHGGTTLSLTASAADPDLPANLLTFSLGPGAPAGASIDATSGELSWASGGSDVGMTNTFTVQVADNGTPELTDAKSFRVVVVSRPIITNIEFVTNAVQLTWTSIPGKQYRLRYKTNLDAAAWLDLPASVTASGVETAGLDVAPAAEQRFYQVRLEP
jgi:hypothetical protein